MQGIVDDALKKVEEQSHSVKTVLVYDHKLAAQRESVPFVEGRDVWWQDAVAQHPTQCDIEWMGAEDPLFKVGIGPVELLHTAVFTPTVSSRGVRHLFLSLPAGKWSPQVTAGGPGSAWPRL